MNRTDLTKLFRRVILANELDNNLKFVTRFSDPDGVRSGKSGWSFGVCQFDLTNNPRAALCLQSCGFSSAEIDGLKSQTIDPKPLESKLVANRAVIEAFDAAQLRGCLDKALRIMAKHNITPADDAALLAIADYDNQYYLSALAKPGYLVGSLAARTRAVTAWDVLTFKLEHTAYGRKRPADCQRRYDNIIRITKGETV